MGRFQSQEPSWRMRAFRFLTPLRSVRNDGWVVSLQGGAQSCARVPKAGIQGWDAGEAPPHLPPLGTRVRGHDGAPPSFLRRPTVFPAKLVLVETGSRNPSLARGRSPVPPPPSGYPRPRARRVSTVFPAKLVLVETGSRNPSLGRGGCHALLPPLGTRRGHDVVPPSFLRSLSSWKSRNPSLARGRSPVPPPPSGYPRPRARRVSTVFPAKLVLVETGSRNPSLGRGGCHAPSPPSGYPRPRARRGSTVPCESRNPSLCAGTTWFHRHSCEACCGNGEQESIPEARGKATLGTRVAEWPPPCREGATRRLPGVPPLAAGFGWRYGVRVES